MISQSTLSLAKDPETVEVRVSQKTLIASEMAAIAGAKNISQLLEDILVDHLVKSGYLPESDLTDG